MKPFLSDNSCSLSIYSLPGVALDTGNWEVTKVESFPSLLADGTGGADSQPAHERALINKIISAGMRPFLPGPCCSASDTLKSRAPKIHDLDTKPCLLIGPHSRPVSELMLHLPTEHLKGLSHRHSSARAFLSYFNPIVESFMATCC